MFPELSPIEKWATIAISTLVVLIARGEVSPIPGSLERLMREVVRAPSGGWSLYSTAAVDCLKYETIDLQKCSPTQPLPVAFNCELIHLPITVLY